MKREQFRLKKVKLSEIKAEVSYQIPDEQKSRTEVIDAAPHPDFEVAVDGLKQYLCDMCFIKDENRENISVNGLSYGGTPEKPTCIILGKLKGVNGNVIALNSPKLNLFTDTYGFEEQVNIIISTISDESYQYLFKKKRKQLEIDFDKEEGKE